MLENVVQVLHERCGIDPPASLVVGVSGGPDSLCLLHLLHALGLEITVAHLDHQLRPDSAEDAAAVEAVAKELRLPFVLRRVDVRALADSRKLSVEEAAREQRYTFL